MASPPRRAPESSTLATPAAESRMWASLRSWNARLCPVHQSEAGLRQTAPPIPFTQRAGNAPVIKQVGDHILERDMPAGDVAVHDRRVSANRAIDVDVRFIALNPRMPVKRH